MGDVARGLQDDRGRCDEARIGGGGVRSAEEVRPNWNGTSMNLQGSSRAGEDQRSWISAVVCCDETQYPAHGKDSRAEEHGLLPSVDQASDVRERDGCVE